MSFLPILSTMIMQKRWVQRISYDNQLVESTSIALGIPSVYVPLFLDRGLNSSEKASQFCNPSLDQLLDPFLMKDMDKAVNRLVDALHGGQKILVYGDYDVDGTTAVTVMFSFLKKMGAHCDYYIPDRYTEGYGFSFQSVEWAKENGVNLIITLDCGVKDGAKIDVANSYGIDIIVCDHHNPGQLPNAFAVLDPKRIDCPYPYKGLSGCGVGFKLIQGFCKQMGLDFQLIEEYLDLLTISIGADIVPLTGENRVLAYHGLQRLKQVKRPGIRAMLNQAGFKRDELTISDVVFILAPRINAAGRILSGRDAVAILLSDTEEHALELSVGIEENNSYRKTLDKGITEEAKHIIESDPFYAHSYTTVVKNAGWHKGVVGIVASRLIEVYYKPTIVLTEVEGKLSGSARSIQNIDLYELLGKCEHLLEQYGGHAMAAGLSLKPENFEAFRAHFDQLVAEVLHHQQAVPVLEYDMELPFKVISKSLFNTINRLAPFGPENMKPVFRSSGCFDSGDTRIVGKEERHLKFALVQEEGERKVEGIGFDMAHWEPHLKKGGKIDVLYTLEENTYNGYTYLQMQIRDVKEHQH